LPRLPLFGPKSARSVHKARDVVEATLQSRVTPEPTGGRTWQRTWQRTGQTTRQGTFLGSERGAAPPMLDFKDPNCSAAAAFPSRSPAADGAEAIGSLFRTRRALPGSRLHAVHGHRRRTSAPGDPILHLAAD
jgi:hypothetical protein